jgi:hypothetical protein
LDKLDAAQTSEKGLVIRRTLDMMSAIALGVWIPMDDIPADELSAMLIIVDERRKNDQDRTSTSHC